MARGRTLAAVRPTSPTQHGAWLGASAGVAVGSVIAGLIQSYVTHKQLPGTDITLIDGVCGALVAYIGSRVMPVLRKIEGPAVVTDGPGQPVTPVSAGGAGVTSAGTAGYASGGVVPPV